MLLLQVFDSLFIDNRSRGLQDQLDRRYPFLVTSDEHVEFEFKKPQQQAGFKDCGLFAAATALRIAMDEDPMTAGRLNQENMRKHLWKCLMTNRLTPFPLMTSENCPTSVDYNDPSILFVFIFK